MIRQLVTNPCRDACGTVATGDVVDGAAVFRCPGCESTWVDVEDPASASEDGNPGQPSSAS